MKKMSLLLCNTKSTHVHMWNQQSSMRACLVKKIKKIKLKCQYLSIESRACSVHSFSLRAYVCLMSVAARKV